MQTISISSLLQRLNMSETLTLFFFLKYYRHENCAKDQTLQCFDLLKWEHPHGFMEEKMYLYKVEVNGETRFFPHEQRFRTKIAFQ